MRLDKIKIAGFKSFVDPTTVHLPSNLTGVVGPNGCGKSNIIDAVRWVMGESSAKHLRGDSMADVIFNGSSGRKPVGHATIELVFDNADGTIGGQYANYNEISVKRLVSRDGQSQYFLNGARCRRRDITDIFLGTGLGPRSYSIIEQGMISRLIEAKPEELRVYLEEAAGISKYKERRRETENRIRHTRENLDRLNDLREEIDKQLQHLNRQAKTAEKYKILKQEERQQKAELLALRLRNLDKEAASQQKIIHERETALEAARAEQQSIETSLEKDRDAHVEASDIFNEIQSRFYAIGSEIARDEQAIHHAKEMRNKQQRDLEQLEQNWKEIRSHIESDERQITELQAALENATPALDALRRQENDSHQALTESEERMNQWQREWEEFNQRAAASSEKSQVQKTRIEHLERQIVLNQQRLERVEQELSEVVPGSAEQEVALLQQRDLDSTSRLSDQSEKLGLTLEQIQALRQETRELNQQLDEARGRLQSHQGRLSSLEALQQAALGKSDVSVVHWLEERGLQAAPRLAQELDVEPGWERAAEIVLGFHLEAVCVDRMDSVATVIDELKQGSLALFDTGFRSSETANRAIATGLMEKVRAPWPLHAMLGGIYTANDLSTAIQMRDQLQDHESVITRDGIWIGRSWIRLERDVDEKAGVIAREQEIKQLGRECEEIQQQVQSLQQQLESGRERLNTLEQQRETLQKEVNESHREQAEIRSQLSSLQSRIEHIRTRHQNLTTEREELLGHLDREGDILKEARSLLTAALESIEAIGQERDQLVNQRDQLRELLDQSRTRARADRDEVHKLALQHQSMNSQLQSTGQNLQRMQAQIQGLQDNREALQTSLEAAIKPLQEMEERLASMLKDRVGVEAELTEARKALENIDAHMRELDQNRHHAENKVQEVRTSLEEAKMGWQEFNIRGRTLREQLEQTGFELQPLLEALADDATEQEWQEKVQNIEQRISRLGSINLAAIEEFAEQSERKKYLDAQNEDVTEALTTLENAIRRIDKETRTRFQETFDRVNNGLKEKFPRVFGGGHAYLELTGEDLLDAGVSVMARPPGKRNSSIHLLSGGEKALTAVALVFAIFELNPAPFCMLDEVDAPLDDANVGRFCELVKEMSERVQFIFITHNKVTMAMANQLAGVTMHEPGVSRMVAVDVDEAVRLAAV